MLTYPYWESNYHDILPEHWKQMLLFFASAKFTWIASAGGGLQQCNELQNNLLLYFVLSRVPERCCYQHTVISERYNDEHPFLPTMTSSNGNNFRITDPLCGGFNGPRWIPLTKASDAVMFSLICAWIKDWLSNRENGDWRRHRAHHDVTVMKYPTCRFHNLIHGNHCRL